MSYNLRGFSFLVLVVLLGNVVQTPKCLTKLLFIPRRAFRSQPLQWSWLEKMATALHGGAKRAALGGFSGRAKLYN